jgi:hypothetical protein
MALSATDAETFERCIAVGGIAVFPADTVYGLACEPDSKEAVQRLYMLKRRRPDKPAAVMFFALDLALAALPELGPRTTAALHALMPGPVTALLSNPAGRFPLACATDAGTLGCACRRGRPRSPRSPTCAGRCCSRAPTPPAARTRAAWTRCLSTCAPMPTSSSTAASCPGRRRRWSTCAHSKRKERGRSRARRHVRHGARSAARVRAVTTSAFVTGGSGFIGGALVRRLVADGWTVRALARSDASADAVRERGAEPVRGELDDLSSMAVGAAGCEVTFHCAAHLGDWGAREDFERGNVAGTRNALAAARQAGVRRFVHVGTEAALLAGEPLVEVDERAPLRFDSPALYSSTKARAEEAVIEANRNGFETVIVRPRFVWGRGDTTLLPRWPRWFAPGASRGSAAAGSARRPPTSTTPSKG